MVGFLAGSYSSFCGLLCVCSFFVAFGCLFVFVAFRLFVCSRGLSVDCLFVVAFPLIVCFCGLSVVCFFVVAFCWLGCCCGLFFVWLCGLLFVILFLWPLFVCSPDS